MRFEELEIPGVFLIDLETFEDERGAFARTFCRDAMRRHGLDPPVEQCSQSINRRRGTLRGLHCQHAPHAEAKLVRCIRGALFDVAVDLRRDSPSFGRWLGVELTAERPRQLWIPEGCAHGFLTLADDTWIAYQMNVAYAPDAGAGVRWDDPEIGVRWPAEPELLSQKDRDLPRLRELPEKDLFGGTT